MFKRQQGFLYEKIPGDEPGINLALSHKPIYIHTNNNYFATLSSSLFSTT
jgi:hypothetical protein